MKKNKVRTFRSTIKANANTVGQVLNLLQGVYRDIGTISYNDAIAILNGLVPYSDTPWQDVIRASDLRDRLGDSDCVKYFTHNFRPCEKDDEDLCYIWVDTGITDVITKEHTLSHLELPDVTLWLAFVRYDTAEEFQFYRIGSYAKLEKNADEYLDLHGIPKYGTDTAHRVSRSQNTKSIESIFTDNVATELDAACVHSFILCVQHKIQEEIQSDGEHQFIDNSDKSMIAYLMEPPANPRGAMSYVVHQIFTVGGKYELKEPQVKTAKSELIELGFTKNDIDNLSPVRLFANDGNTPLVSMPLLCDIDMGMESCYDHIFNERGYRLPESVDDRSFAAKCWLLRENIKRGTIYTQRYYNWCRPYYSLRDDSYAFLLPFYANIDNYGQGPADAAIVLSREVGSAYFVPVTVLEMCDAYADMSAISDPVCAWMPDKTVLNQQLNERKE